MWIIACLTVLALPVTAAAQDPDPVNVIGPAADTITVRGEVLDAATERPLVGVLVALHDLWKVTRTDELGYFEFEDVPVGLHELGVYGLGYQTVERLLELEPNEILAVNLDPAPLQLEGVEVEVLGRQIMEYRSTGVRYDFIAGELLEKYRVRYGAIVDMIRARFPSVYVHQLGSAGSEFCLMSTRTSSSPTDDQDGCAALFLDGRPAESVEIAELHVDEIQSIRYIPRIEALLMYGDRGRYGVLLVTTEDGRRR